MLRASVIGACLLSGTLPAQAEPLLSFQEEGQDHTKYHFTLDSVDATYYDTGANSLVIVLPIWGSSTFPSVRLTEVLVDRGGMDVLEVHGVDELIMYTRLRDAQTDDEFVNIAYESAERFMETVRTLEAIITWANERGKKISLVGFSMGSMVASVVLGRDTDHRIERGVLVVGGANPGQIFAQCKNKVAWVRENALVNLGWTKERFESFFTEVFADGNPTMYEGNYRPERLLMINAVFDGCMRKESRRALREATGHPKQIYIPSGHKTAFIGMTPAGLGLMSRAIYRFLKADM